MHKRKIIRYILSLPKTVYFNFAVLKFQDAMKLPFFVDYDVRLGRLHKNIVIFEYLPKRFDIKIGENNVDGVTKTNRGYIDFSPKSKFILGGTAEFSSGITLVALDSGIIKIGDNFFCNKNCSIVCRDAITIGKDVLMGWNISIRDSDGETHHISCNGKLNTNHKPILISDHVWICAHSHILKGVTLQPDSVVAYNSCVTKTFKERNIILGGSPAKIIKKDIEWWR